MESRDQVFQQVQETFRSIFKDPILVIANESTARTVENWDSMNHIRLIAALEKQFKCKFLLGELQRIQNVGGLVDLIAQKVR